MQTTCRNEAGPSDARPVVLFHGLRGSHACPLADFAVDNRARAVLAVYRPLLEPLGRTHPQYLVILALWDHQKEPAGQLAPLTVKQIASAPMNVADDERCYRPRCDGLADVVHRCVESEILSRLYDSAAR